MAIYESMWERQKGEKGGEGDKQTMSFVGENVQVGVTSLRIINMKIDQCSASKVTQKSWYNLYVIHRCKYCMKVDLL